ncbi:MAG: hypothetical protein HUJ26_17600 [Planctomycetaceae bacterium]|nr:hypothetical protein [Planctomycetaceae bacterium]
MRLNQSDLLQVFGEVTRSHLSPATRLREVFVDQDQSHLDPLLFAQFIYLKTTFALPDDEWGKILSKGNSSKQYWDLLEFTWDDVSESVTFGEIADAFLKRIPGLQFQPLNICGVDCLPAGVFYDLKSIVSPWEHQRHISVMPSTKLEDAIGRRSLWYFWTRLEFLSKRKLPQVKNLFHSILFSLTCFLGLIFLIACLFHLISSAALLSLPVTGISLTILAYILIGLRVSDYYWSPKSIQTFRDLAEFIAQSRDETNLDTYTGVSGTA